MFISKKKSLCLIYPQIQKDILMNAVHAYILLNLKYQRNKNLKTKRTALSNSKKKVF